MYCYLQFYNHAAQQGVSPTDKWGTSPTREATKLLTILEEVKETVHGKILNALLKKKDGLVVEFPEGVVLPLKAQGDLETLAGGS